MIMVRYVVTVKAHPAKSAMEGGMWESGSKAYIDEAYSFLRGVGQNPSLPDPRSWRILI